MQLLFIDPSRAFQKIVTAQFLDSGVEIRFAENRAEAEHLLESNWGFICTVRHLPDGDGLALCRHLRSLPQYQHTPVILFTADTAETLLQDAAQAGITEVFLKTQVGELIHFVGRYTARARKIEGRVLYVEDNASQALLAQAQLANLGLSVDWCGSAEEAWSTFQKRDYDLVLTDIVLAGAMSGATLISRIRSLHGERGDVPVIAITAFDQLARRIELFHLGVSDYVAKPIVEEELASRVRNLIARHQAERAMKQQEKRRFDETLLTLSRTLNTASGDLTSTLGEICRRVVETLGVSRASIWLLSDDRSQMTCRVMHDPGELGSDFQATITRADYPAYFDALLTERAIVAPDAGTHPATAELGESYLIPNNILALLDIPLGSADSRIGVLCHEVIGAGRNWTGEEENFATAIGDLATLAIESHQRWLADQQLRLAGLVFDAAAEAILICDSSNRIVSANDAFAAITGYTIGEVVGKTPSMFKSGRHDEAFYADMWRSLVSIGKWQGEVWDRRKDGSEYPKRLSITRVLDGDGVVSHYIGVFNDISQEKQDQDQLRYLAYNDVLTRLPNRVFGEAALAQVLAQAASRGDGAVLMCFDVDRFKKINSSFGHATGDAMLCEVARRLQGALCSESHLARWSGSSFMATLDLRTDAEAAVTLAQHCVDAFRQPFVVGDRELQVTLSIGIALYPQHGSTPADLIKNAMTALGHAKDCGGNRYVFFNAEMEKTTMAHLLLESRLRRAIEQQQFVLHYQPKVDVVTHAVVGMEALVRWQDPLEGILAPGAFLGLAEQTGQIYPINSWVMHEACRQNAEWHRAHGLNLPVAVNLPAGVFSHADLEAEVRHILRDTGLPPELLELELTESAMVDDPQRAIEIFQQLKGLGVRIAIDDFGTGYSSLSYLRRFPIDILKIDRSFITHLGSADDELVIVSSIIGLAKSLRLKTVAEGIERDGQATILQDLGCDQLQGYLFGRPMAGQDFLLRIGKSGT